MTSALARELVRAGRTAATCPEDGTTFDPTRDYAGHPHGGDPRATCSLACWRRRRNRRARELREHRKQTAGIRAMYAIESTGQVPIPDVGELPELPPDPPVDP